MSHYAHLSNLLSLYSNVVEYPPDVPHLPPPQPHYHTAPAADLAERRVLEESPWHHIGHLGRPPAGGSCAGRPAH